MQYFNSNGAKFAYVTTNDMGNNIITPDKALIIWAHGWGHSHENLMKLAAPFKDLANNIILDFPGFGNSPPPPDNWGTQDYALAIASWLKENNLPPAIWVGHSFGCRVGLQIAANSPEQIKAMALISAAGLKRKRSLLKKIYLFLRIKLFKFLKKILPKSNLKDKIMQAFGSADYKNANNEIRKIFIRTVNEDLSAQAQKVKCPVALIYGKNDTDTPPEFGERFSHLIPRAKLFLLDGQDHISVLENARHQVIKILNDFIKENTGK